MRQHYFNFIAAVAIIGAAIAWAQIQIWPLPLRLPGGDQWWAWLFICAPLLAMPLTATPRLAMPMLFTLGGIGITAMIIFAEPDAFRCIVCICGFLVALLIFEPRLISGCRWILGWLPGWRPRPNRKDPPAEFSPALVPRGPRKPAPLIAHARPAVERDA